MAKFEMAYMASSFKDPGMTSPFSSSSGSGSVLTRFFQKLVSWSLPTEVSPCMPWRMVCWMSALESLGGLSDLADEASESANGS